MHPRAIAVTTRAWLVVAAVLGVGAPSVAAQRATAPPQSWGGLVELSRLPMKRVLAVTLDSGIAYLARGDAGLTMVDVGDPTMPRKLGETSFLSEEPEDWPTAWAFDVAIGPGTPRSAIMAATAGIDGLIVADVTDPGRIHEIAFLGDCRVYDLGFATMDCQAMRVSDATARAMQPTSVTADERTGNVPPGGYSTPAPTERPNTAYGFLPLEFVATVGDHVFVAAGIGIAGFDVSDAYTPRLLVPKLLWEGWPRAVAAEGDALVVIGPEQREEQDTPARTGLFQLKIGPDGTLSERQFVDLAGSWRHDDELGGAAMREGVVAVAAGERGVAVIDINKAMQGHEPVWYQTTQPAVAVRWSDDGLLFVAESRTPVHHRQPGEAEPGRNGALRVIDIKHAPISDVRSWTIAYLPTELSG